eukprot:gene2646-5196_t
MSDKQTILVRESGGLPLIKTNLVWTHLKEVRNISYESPKINNSTFFIASFDNIRLDVQAGVLFDSNGCIPSYIKKGSDWIYRYRRMNKFKIYPLPPNKIKYDYESLIVIWGSPFSKDWQHSVIDFLPLYSFALPFLLKHTNIPIIAGSYTRFYQNIFPFNLSTFISRDRFISGGVGTIITAKRLYWIDIAYRRHSELIPGIYDPILPYLHTYLHNREVAINVYKHKHHSLSTNNTKQNISSTTTTTPVLRKNLVVYLDRSKDLTKDVHYRRDAGVINGRGVSNQKELVTAISRVLSPEYELVVHTCVDWRTDKAVMARTVVMIGAHGGHFANMIFAPADTHVIEFSRNSLLETLHLPYIDSQPRLVYQELSASLGHRHWTVEDMVAVDELSVQINNNKKLNVIREKPSVIGHHKKRQRGGRSSSAIWKENPLVLTWSDKDMVVNPKQLTDTLRAIGVAK